MIRLLVALAALAAAPVSVDWDSPQQLVGIGAGRHIHVRCLGKGSPTVIFTSGLGESGENWRTVMPQIAEHTRVCAWDRAGVGFSDPTTLPQDAAHTTSDLEQALRAAGTGPPYVMVGHSIGSFETLLFTYRHPGEVAGMVLVDPSSPYQNRAFAAAAPGFGVWLADRMSARNKGLADCILALKSGRSDAPECAPIGSRGTVAHRIGLAHSMVSLGEEMGGRSSAELVSARRPLGDMPLIVLTAGKSAPLPTELAAEEPKVKAAWMQMHDALAAQSSRGENRVVEDATHYIHRDKPDAVIAAVDEVIEAVRQGGLPQ